MLTRKKKKSQPNDILANAIYMGLVSLVRLASKRTSEKTRKHYTSIKSMWQKWREQFEQSIARKITDFSPVEPNMRNQFLGIVWNSTRRFGNREFKRVYSWLEGTVGPLNSLLNYAGARLRDLAMTRYPFPEPESFQIKKYSDGSKKILSKEEAELLGPDDAVKTYWRGGYRRKGKSPLILLAHPTLPELDFVDMIRAHMIELCRQCFVHNVPRAEAHRYIKLLIHRLRPFLDWVYTDGKQGRPYFNRYSDHELREIVQEIRSLYGKRTGKEKSITEGLDAPETPILSIEEFRDKVEKLRDNTNDEKERTIFSKILNHIDEGNIEQRDVEKVIDQILALSSREGNEWHRILLSDLHHPSSLKQVVFAGDNMLDDPSAVLIVGELPVSRRKGQIDLVIFLRREVSGRVIWTPVMILEIKTKMSLDYNLYGLRTKNKSVKDYGPALYAWKTTKTEDEWKEIFTSAPAPRTLDQLNVYESELLLEYGQVAAFDPTPPKSLWKGVIVLDTDQSPLEVFEGFQDLLEDLVTKITYDSLDITETTAYSLNPSVSTKTPRIATILTPGGGPVELLNEACVPESLPVDDPFCERISDDRLLTLYVPVSSPISSGNAAAWISRNWHLLNHIQECATSSKDTEIHWVDLMGDYPSELLTKKRFGLDLLLKVKGIDKKKHTTLDGLIDKIRFINLSTSINQILAGTDLGLDSLIDNLSLSFQDESVGEKIIVIDGWSEFKDLVPSSRQHIIRALEKRLLNSLPTSNINVIWIDSGVQHTRMNKYYQRRCISPLPYDSPRKMHVDEIIYNLPTSSRGFGRFLPKSDDERFIVQDVPASAQPWRTKIHVPHLIDYSKKFRGSQRRKPTLPEEEVYGKNLRPMYGRGITLSNIYSDTSRYSKRQVSELEEFALSLAPSTLRARGEPTKDQEQELVSDTPPRQLVTPIVVTGNPSTLSRRLRYSPDAPPPKPNKAKREYVPNKRITRRLYYERVPSQDFDKDEEFMVMRPPTIRLSISNYIDSRRTRGMELRRLLHAARFLKKKKALSKNLRSCCDKITTLCVKALSTEFDESKLLRALERVREIILEDPKRARVWETVRPIRQGLFELLNSGNRAVLETVLERSPDVLLLYGNNLFLVILAVLDREYNEVMHTHVVPLWQSVVEWEMYQLGFKAQQGSVISKYDLHSIYSNLMNRARLLSALGIPEHVLSKQQAGQIIWTEKEGKHSAWVIFQSEKGIVVGLIDNLQSQWLRPSWYQCVSDSQILKEKAEQALYSHDRNTIVVTEINNHKILWMLTEGEEGHVWLSSVLEHGTSKKKGQSIPWIILRETYEVPALHDEVIVPPILPADIEKHVDDFLKEAASLKQEVIYTTCEVSINVNKRVYELEFKDKSRGTTLDTLLFKDTTELIKTLRHPIRRGTPLRIKNGSLVMWDHRTDIQYSGCDFKQGNTREIFSVTFLKPLVHRSRFHPDVYEYPKTCDDLLSTTMGDKVTLTIRPQDNRFCIELKGISVKSSLKQLEGLELNIHDLGFLTECEQLVDTKRKTRHNVEIEAKDLLGCRVSRQSDYPRLQEAVSSLDVADYDWTREQWRVKVTESQDGSDIIKWTIRSQKSGAIWMNNSFTFQLDYTKSLEQHLNQFKEVVRKTVPLEHLSEFSETLVEFERILRILGLGEVKPRYRLDLDVREGMNVAVVSRIEQDVGPKEISSFPIEIANLENLTELMTADGGPLSIYDIMNIEEFNDSVRKVSTEEQEEKEGGVSEPDDEVELLCVIKEYREEQDPRGLGHALASLARHRLIQNRTSDAMVAVEEAIILLRGCDLLNRLVRSDLASALVTKAEIILKKDGEVKVAWDLLGEAKEIVRLLLETLRPGRSDIILQETAERIKRQIQLFTLSELKVILQNDLDNKEIL